MSGPPYPRYAPGAAPGKNTIGVGFEIATSPIGDVPPFDVWTTILSQYANSPIITQLCVNMGQYVDQTKNFSDFFDNVWNIDTAFGNGLDIWGRILGVSRVVQLTGGSQPFLGFEEPGTPTTLTPFGQAPFFSGQSVSSNFSLSDTAYRTLLLAKALANICDGSIPAINQILRNLFPGRGNCYIADGLNLTMTYTFAFALSPVELAIVQTSGVLPRTSGVAVSVSHP